MTVTIKSSGYQLTDDPSTPRTDATVPFRDIIPRPDHPRIKGITSHNAHSWCSSRREVPEPAWLINRLELKNVERPYKGFSADGNPDASLWVYKEDEGAPVEGAVAAAKAFLEGISEEDRKEVVKGDVETDDEFRAWSNPELYVNPGGIRLDETDTKTQELIHGILKASLSPAGYEKALGCTLTNAFLGQLIKGEKVLNEHSYNFRLFGTPSLNAPWGFSFFGHHLCLQVVFVGRRMVIGPTFMGAEPDRIDEGPHAGLRLFSQEEVRGLNLMRSLSEENQKRAQVNGDMVKGLPEDRWNPFDERHLGGAHQDNRTVPYEGLPVSAMTPAQREEIWELVKTFNVYLPDGPLNAHMERVKKFEGETWFAWIGGYGLGDPYYFRTHSPVVFCEFDFHCGIFLTNTSPAKCHIHTVNRLPNVGDYGKALIRQYHAEQEKKEEA